MKPITVLLVAGFLLISCDKNTPEVGEGFEIYLTQTPYTHDLGFDYSTVDFDTIALEEIPILRYNDLVSYETSGHKLTLGISHDSLNIGDTGVYGRMFVVTIDKQPVYCGFKWTMISSIGCNWVYIMEPFGELDHLQENEIVISFSSSIYPDPRLDPRIMERLSADRKIKTSN